MGWDTRRVSALIQVPGSNVCPALCVKGLLSPCDTCASTDLPWGAAPTSSAGSHPVLWSSREECEEGVAIQPHGQEVVCCDIDLCNHYVFVAFVLLSQLIPDQQELPALVGPRGICKFKIKLEGHRSACGGVITGEYPALQVNRVWGSSCGQYLLETVCPSWISCFYIVINSYSLTHFW